MDRTETTVKETITLNKEEYLSLINQGVAEDDELIIEVPDKQRMPVLARLIDV